MADVAGAFVLRGVLTAGECAQLGGLASAMGFRPDAPLSSGRPLRRNANLVWIADTSLWEPIWRRVAPWLPAVDGAGAPLALNQRWRLYRYEEGNDFGMHHDGAWPESGLDAARGTYVRDLHAGTRRSQMTLLLYLHPLDAYAGGETTFQLETDVDDSLQRAESAEGVATRRVGVRVPQGGALCFYHGEHPLSPLHEGSEVTRGVKVVVRTDVMYRASAEVDDESEEAVELAPIG